MYVKNATTYKYNYWSINQSIIDPDWYRSPHWALIYLWKWYPAPPEYNRRPSDHTGTLTTTILSGIFPTSFWHHINITNGTFIILIAEFKNKLKNGKEQSVFAICVQDCCIMQLI